MGLFRTWREGVGWVMEAMGKWVRRRFRLDVEADGRRGCL